MLVKDLIALLEQEDENAVVLLSSDEEGNSFSRCSYSFGTAETEEQKKVMEDETYGLEKEDMDKNWVILYPEL